MCKIKKLVYGDGDNVKHPTGARVQWWESSTRDEDPQAWLTDPWHCNADMMDGARLDRYDFLPASDFQAKVKMVKWRKPGGFRKTLRTIGNARGIVRLKLKSTEVNKVKTYMHRWMLDVQVPNA